MREIPLTNGGAALVDDEDYDRLAQFEWREMSGYVVRMGNTRRTGKTIFMHHEVLRDRWEGRVDHLNGNTRDNRRGNLRPCTHQQNMWNMRKMRSSRWGERTTSRFKGVSRIKARRWVAQIRVNGKNLFLGGFTNEEEAARVYDAAACYYFGEFARPNFGFVPPEEQKRCFAQIEFKRTHCLRGHARTPDNVGKNHQCLTCVREKDRARSR